MLFKEVIGQNATKKKLLKVSLDNRISHAMLFLGDSGSGVLPMALAYIQYIQCENKQEEDACGNCPSCQKNMKGIHPDVHFAFPVATTKSVTKDPVSDDFLSSWRELIIEDPYFNLEQWYNYIGLENKQGQIGRSESQQIIKKLQLKSFESEYKIMLVWMAEKINDIAANKLLKLIEEPSEKTLFLFIAENTDSILPTILSRTQILKIPGIKTSYIKNQLTLKHGLNENEADNIAKLSKGNYIEAKQLIQLTEEDAYNFKQFTQLMRLCYSRKLESLFEWVDEISTLGREKIKNFFAYSLRMTHENYILNLGLNQLSRLRKEEADFSNNFNPYVNAANAQLIAHEFEKASGDIERNAYNKIVLLDMALKITKLIRLK